MIKKNIGSHSLCIQVESMLESSGEMKFTHTHTPGEEQLLTLPGDRSQRSVDTANAGKFKPNESVILSGGKVSY